MREKEAGRERKRRMADGGSGSWHSAGLAAGTSRWACQGVGPPPSLVAAAPAYERVDCE